MTRATLGAVALAGLCAVMSILFAAPAGAHMFAITTDTRCLATGETWVEWSFENDTARTFTITESTPSLPPEIGPATTVTAITILPPGWTGTTWADIRGYWTQPDDSLLWWVDGASLTIEENLCGSTPTTAPTPTTILPPVEKVQVTSTTTVGTPTGPASTPTTATDTTTTGMTVSPTTTTMSESMLEAGNITGPATTTTTLAATGNQTFALICAGIVTITCGITMVLVGRRKP